MVAAGAKVARPDITSKGIMVCAVAMNGIGCFGFSTNVVDFECFLACLSFFGFVLTVDHDPVEGRQCSFSRSSQGLKRCFHQLPEASSSVFPHFLGEI